MAAPSTVENDTAAMAIALPTMARAGPSDWEYTQKFPDLHQHLQRLARWGALWRDPATATYQFQPTSTFITTSSVASGPNHAILTRAFCALGDIIAYVLANNDMAPVPDPLRQVVATICTYALLDIGPPPTSPSPSCLSLSSAFSPSPLPPFTP